MTSAGLGKLHLLILDKYERNDEVTDASFVSLAVQLHNEGAIDLFAALSPEALGSIGGFSFFTLQQFYCTAIPRMETEPKPLMTAVSRLVKAGGEDMAANYPNGAYRDWCSAKPERPRLVLKLIDAGDEEAKAYLSLTLEAGAIFDIHDYMSKSIAYLQKERQLQLGAMTALARFKSANETELARAAFNAMETLLSGEDDDMVRTHVLAAIVGLYIQSPIELHDAALNLATRAVEHRNDGVLHRCAMSLFSDGKHLSEALIKLLLTALQAINPLNKGTLNLLDDALAALLKLGHRQHVSEFLKTIFVNYPDSLSFKQFDSVARTLTTSESALGDDMTVRWFMTGNTSLASNISELMGSVGREPKIFAIDIQTYSLSEAESIFLARKAVGWLFFHPITAASLIICVLRTVEGEAAKTIGDLLFEPLLLNYSGELKEYLESCITLPHDNATPELRRAIDRLDSYLDDLRTVGWIKELAPSEHERFIEQQLHNEKMLEIQKNTEQESILLSIVSKSIILHGNGSVGYRRGADGKLHRYAMKMTNFSTTWEFPRLQTLDPFGLDIQIRRLRAERPPS